MQHAIASHVRVIMTDWYDWVSRWEPPGESSALCCVPCQHSDFSTALGLDAWPHAVRHPLLRRLQAAVDEVQELQGHMTADAVAAIASELALHRLDALDVLRHTVGPRLDAFVFTEAHAIARQLQLLY
jgi:hypothetical protein